MMKIISASAIIAAMATSSFAGSLADPIVDTAPEGVFVPETGSGIGVPAILGGALLLGAVAVIASDDDDSSSTTTGSAD
ncbi:hypothetical protein C1J03_22070 [Sulfitobacter sp. SK012]|uniref:hypothetical protein n=1 Tax=Sulfitobacter sp. SK012 TaxID=1389005 RepID=UPI000E0A78FE|nr:hypothetical protein [Sulfitobacter sp. SK012]AXI48440.1 hypothetical protein C1J03_22070 [Sulfitobacter sp. SK012]